jgi:kynurenine formamidase
VGRTESVAAAGITGNTPMMIDLSHPLEPGMPSYPGLPEPELRTWLTHEENEERGFLVLISGN